MFLSLQLQPPLGCTATKYSRRGWVEVKNNVFWNTEAWKHFVEAPKIKVCTWKWAWTKMSPFNWLSPPAHMYEESVRTCWTWWGNMVSCTEPVDQGVPWLLGHMPYSWYVHGWTPSWGSFWHIIPLSHPVSSLFDTDCEIQATARKDMLAMSGCLHWMALLG